MFVNFIALYVVRYSADTWVSEDTIWMSEVAALFVFHLDISLKRLNLTATNFTQFAWYFDRDSKRARSEHRPRSLPVYDPSRLKLYL